jgi:hypothetical protein
VIGSAQVTTNSPFVGEVGFGDNRAAHGGGLAVRTWVDEASATTAGVALKALADRCLIANRAAHEGGSAAANGGPPTRALSSSVIRVLGGQACAIIAGVALVDGVVVANRAAHQGRLVAAAKALIAEASATTAGVTLKAQVDRAVIPNRTAYKGGLAAASNRPPTRALPADIGSPTGAPSADIGPLAGALSAAAARTLVAETSAIIADVVLKAQVGGIVIANRAAYEA